MIRNFRKSYGNCMVLVCFRGFKIKSTDGPIIIIIVFANPPFRNIGCGRRLDPSRHPPFLHSHVPQKGPRRLRCLMPTTSHYPFSPSGRNPDPPPPVKGGSCHHSPPHAHLPSPHPTPRVQGLPNGRGSADCGQCVAVGCNVTGTSTRPHPTHPPDRIIYPSVGGGAVR